MAVVPDPVTFKVVAFTDSAWSLVGGVGGNDDTFPFASPGDFVPALGPASGDWFYQASARVAVADFSANIGTIKLHNFVPQVPVSDLVLSGKGKDNEFRAYYSTAISDSGYRPSAAAAPLSGPARHRTVTAALVQATEDTALYRSGELLVLVFSESYDLSDQNVIVAPSTGGDTGVAVYRTSNLLIAP